MVKLCADNYAFHDGLFNGADGVFHTSPNHMIVNPSYRLFLIIQKLVLQPRYKINTCTQPIFQNSGHHYNQFLKRYKWVLIQAK